MDKLKLKGGRNLEEVLGIAPERVRVINEFLETTIITAMKLEVGNTKMQILDALTFPATHEERAYIMYQMGMLIERFIAPRKIK